MRVGYRRTSGMMQIAGLEAQDRDLRATGCTKVILEQVSSMAAVRDGLVAAIDFVREGDTLVVTRLDRLARSTADLLRIVDALEKKGVALLVLDFGGSEVDTKSPSGRMILTVFGAMAQFERELMLARQAEGVHRAKAAGKYRGRAPTARAKSSQVHELRAAGMGATAIATKLNIGRASVYRVLAEARPA